MKAKAKIETSVVLEMSTEEAMTLSRLMNATKLSPCNRSDAIDVIKDDLNDVADELGRCLRRLCEDANEN